MTTWIVLKNDRTGLEDYDPDRWYEAGTHESDYGYTLGWNAASEIGGKHGAGEYLCLSDEHHNFVRITIAARQEFYEISEDERGAERGFVDSDDRQEWATDAERDAGTFLRSEEFPEGIPEGSTLTEVGDPRD